ncbi:MAG: hypothetical protein K1X79_06375 [Oligoflexia bacterium]|nr:hypothetical protein [Oligoflexia bacterium]
MSSDIQKARLLRKIVIAQAAQWAIDGLAKQPNCSAHRAFLNNIRSFELPGYEVNKPLGVGAAAIDTLQRLARKLGLELSIEQRECSYVRLEAIFSRVEHIRGELNKLYRLEDKTLSRIFQNCVTEVLLDSDLVLHCPTAEASEFSTEEENVLCKLRKQAEHKLNTTTNPIPAESSLQDLSSPFSLIEVCLDHPAHVVKRKITRELAVADNDCVTFICNTEADSDPARNAQKMRALVERAAQNCLIPSPDNFTRTAIVSSYFRGRELIRRNAYVGVRFGQREHYISLRDISTGRSGSYIERIRLLTGLCLWSTETARVIVGSGKSLPIVDPKQAIDEAVVDLQVTSDLSLYELDSLNRLSGLLSSIAIAEKRPIDLALNIPRLEYYLYLLPAFGKGLVSVQLFRRWCELVEARRACLIRELCVRLPSGLKVQTIDPLLGIEPTIARIVESGCKDSEQEINAACQALSQSSSIWNQVLKQEVPAPRTWTDLNTLGYAVAVLESADERGVSLIAVENRHEARIYEKVEALNRKINKSINLVVLLSHEQVMTKWQNRSLFDNLYFLPVNNPSLNATYREIAEKCVEA